MRLQLVFGYHGFRKWRRELPFQLNGWEEVVDSDIISDDCTWASKFKLNVEYDGTTEDDVRNISAYLTVLTKKVNKCFYEPESIIESYSGDPRIPFQVEEYSISGSANCEIVKVIRRFLMDDLSMLERRSHLIKSVNLWFANELYKVYPKPLETDSSGG